MIDKPDRPTLGDFLDDKTEQAVRAERAAIVAWLRNSDVPRGQDIADAIEAGRHHEVGIDLEEFSISGCADCECAAAGRCLMPKSCWLDAGTETI